MDGRRDDVGEWKDVKARNGRVWKSRRGDVGEWKDVNQKAREGGAYRMKGREVGRRCESVSKRRREHTSCISVKAAAGKGKLKPRNIHHFNLKFTLFHLSEMRERARQLLGRWRGCI